MKTSVQARLDEETQAALDRLVRRHGMSVSEVIREGIRLVAKQQGTGAVRRMIGIGMYASGVPDMGSNKKYLEGLGTNSGIGLKPSSRSKLKAS
jgi:Arc/MetJ-type ribon-helix-helix transcriptional regulator